MQNPESLEDSNRSDFLSSGEMETLDLKQDVLSLSLGDVEEKLIKSEERDPMEEEPKSPQQTNYAYPTKKKKRWDADQIIPGLYMGDQKSAHDRAKLKELGITHILNVVGGGAGYPDDFKYLIISSFDSKEHDMISKFEKTSNFIDQAIDEGGACLVHCQKGISRSGVVVMAYLMRKRNMTFGDVVDFVVGRRASCCPNLGFLKQLQLYEQMKFDLEGDSTSHAEYQQLRMKSYLTDELVRWRDDPDKVKEPYLGDVLAKDIKNSRGAYHCKRCDNKLIDASFEVLHEDPESKQVSATDSVFTIPFSWMGNISEEEGRIDCPHCKTVIGGWNWHGREGTNIKPVFFLIRKLLNEHKAPPKSDVSSTTSSESKMDVSSDKPSDVSLAKTDGSSDAKSEKPSEIKSETKSEKPSDVSSEIKSESKSDVSSDHATNGVHDAKKESHKDHPVEPIEKPSSHSDPSPSKTDDHPSDVSSSHASDASQSDAPSTSDASDAPMENGDIDEREQNHQVALQLDDVPDVIEISQNSQDSQDSQDSQNQSKDDSKEEVTDTKEDVTDVKQVEKEVEDSKENSKEDTKEVEEDVKEDVKEVEDVKDVKPTETAPALKNVKTAPLKIPKLTTTPTTKTTTKATAPVKPTPASPKTTAVPAKKAVTVPAKKASATPASAPSTPTKVKTVSGPVANKTTRPPSNTSATSGTSTSGTSTSGASAKSTTPTNGVPAKKTTTTVPAKTTAKTTTVPAKTSGKTTATGKAPAKEPKEVPKERGKKTSDEYEAIITELEARDVKSQAMIKNLSAQLEEALSKVAMYERK